MSRGKPISPKDPQKIIDRYLGGETAKEIGADFGYNDGHAVCNFLKDAGVRSAPTQEHLRAINAQHCNFKAAR
jgi:hypothetical protein